MPRSATMQASAIPKRSRSRLTTGNSSVTSAVLPGIFHKTDAGIRGHVFCTFLALVLRKELFDRLAARRSRLEWQRVVDDLTDLSEINVEQDGRRARLRTAPGPTIDPICRAVGITLPPV
jgi:hypothetical protein